MNSNLLSSHLIDAGVGFDHCARCHKELDIIEVYEGMSFVCNSLRKGMGGCLCASCTDEFRRFVGNADCADDTQYCWHDLRRDSKDLPPEDVQYGNFICVDEKGNYMTNCLLHYDEQEGCFAAESECEIMYSVVAWRMIEPFRV